MSEPAAPSSTPQESVFAPHFVPDEEPIRQPVQQSAPVKTPPKGQGFESKFADAADRVARDLGVDTSAVDLADGKDAQSVPDHDPLGDAELEIAPGKRLKRKDIAAQLAEFTKLQKSHKDFERAAHAKMQQAAELRKQTEAEKAQYQQAVQIQQRLQQLLSSGANEETLLREFGLDPDKYFQSRIEKQYADLQKTPEQRQQDQFEAREHALRQREEAIARQDQERVERVKQYQAEQETNQTAQQLSQSFMQTADQLKLPKSALTIQRFANLMASAHAAGHNPTMEQLGAKVREMYQQETTEMLEQLTDNDGFQALPKTVQDKIRKSMLAKLGNPAPTAQAMSQAAPRTKQAKPMTTAEYNNYVNQLRTKGG